MTKEKKPICKNCMSCRTSYKGGLCRIKNKRVKYTDTCEDWTEK